MPLCTEPWDEPGAAPVGAVTTVPAVEVVHVFRCTETRTVRLDGGLEGASAPPGANRDRSPQRVEAGVKLGAEDFQQRIVVFGDRSSGLGDAVEAIWRAETRLDELLSTLQRFGVAQAEYYFDDDGRSPRSEWMWSMRWRARLVRFRWPHGSPRVRAGSDVARLNPGALLPATISAACAAGGRGSHAQCSRAEDVLSQLGALVVH